MDVIRPRSMTLSTADLLSNLMYSYKYGLKEQYFKSLDKLQPMLDEALYKFYWNFGNTAQWKKV